MNFLLMLEERGTYARDLAIGLSCNNCQVDVLTCVHKDRAASAMEDRNLFYNNNVKVHRVVVVGKSYLIQLFVCLKVLLLKNKYDFILYNDAGANKMASFFQVFLKHSYKKSFSVFHGSEIYNFLTNPSIALRMSGMYSKLRKYYSSLCGIIAVSDSMRSTIVKALPEVKEKTQTILHGIDDKMFVPLSDDQISKVKLSLGLNEKAAYIFTASRLIRGKGQDNVLKAFAEVERMHADLFLVISGDGPAKADLEVMVAEYDLHNKVIFTGAVDRKRMAELYGASEFYILMSRLHESFGLVFLEANACGRVVIAGKTGGVIEAVQDCVSGFTVDPEDWFHASTIMATLMNNDELKCGMEVSARKRFLGYFTCSAMAERLLNTVSKKISLT